MRSVRSGGMIETRRIYRSVVDIPDHVDLAVILTPAATVPGVLEECGQKGIRWAIIETAGFREYTEDGRRLEEEIAGWQDSTASVSSVPTASAPSTWRTVSACPSPA